MTKPPGLDEKLEELREYSRNLKRNGVLRDREHYGLIALVDDAARIVDRNCDAKDKREA